MDTLALSFELCGLAPELAESACLSLGAHAITFSDERDDAVLEPAPGEVRLWPATRLQALFAGDALAPALQAPVLQAQLSKVLNLEPGRISAQVLPHRAWEREWLRDFHAQRFGRRLWVSPHHEEVTVADAVVVKLDPGLAFGTGTHPSTALCLEWLDAHLTPGVRVIDYGSGSGILGIAAAKLGAARVDAFDIDPQALLATTENAVANGVAPILQAHAAVALLPATAQLVMANILAGTLCELATDLARRVADGGHLLLAGILSDQAEAVADAYAPWFDIHPCGQREHWVALAGTSRIT